MKTTSQIKTYRKKPIIIEAIQYNGGTKKQAKLIINWSKGKVAFSSIQDKLLVETLEGAGMVAIKGDYIIKGIKGEFYPCKSDVFEASYENVWRGQGL